MNASVLSALAAQAAAPEGIAVLVPAEVLRRLLEERVELADALAEQVAEFNKRMREYIEQDDLGIAEIAMAHHGDRMDRSRAALAKAGAP